MASSLSLSSALAQHESSNSAVQNRTRDSLSQTSQAIKSSLESLVEPQPVTLPKIHQSVCYIVSCVIFNPTGTHVLLVQEAKPRCRGKYYLPAGRMEPAETVLEAAKREVLEEAGIDIEILTLFSVQEQGVRWIRFNFIAKALEVNPVLKSEPDNESLGAEWVKVKHFQELAACANGSMDQLSLQFRNQLRADDIVQIILDAHCIYINLMPKSLFHLLVPRCEEDFIKISIRLVVVYERSYCVCTKLPPSRLPELVIPIRPTVEQTISERVMHYLKTFIGNWNTVSQLLECEGMLALGHNGHEGNDGFRLDLLFTLHTVPIETLSAHSHTSSSSAETASSTSISRNSVNKSSSPNSPAGPQPGLPSLLSGKYEWKRLDPDDVIVDNVINSANGYLPCFQCLL